MLMRLLYQTHRWGGVVLALFMVMWLISGLIIAYTSPLPLSHGRRLAHASALQPEEGWLSLGEALQKGAPQSADILRARLVQTGRSPVWLTEDANHKFLALSAIDGSLQRIAPKQAEQIAKRWLGSDSATFSDTLNSVSSLRNYKHLAPFHRVAANSGDGTELLISAVTGEVLQVSTRLDRALYLSGNWLHFFRPIESLGASETRRDVLMWSGLAATIAALTGLIIGWLRWRPGFFGRPTYSGGRTQPYRRFWLRWHFWSGLVGGTAAFLWALSGYLNNNPGQIFSTAGAAQAELNRFHDGKLPEAAMNWRPSQLAADPSARIVEVQWSHVGPQAALVAYDHRGEIRTVQAEGAVSAFSEQAVRAAAQRLAGGAPAVSVNKLERYDSYYYLFHNRDAFERPLPVLRVDVADASGSTLYVDPQDGRLVLKLDSSRKVYRWLFSAIHRWDFGWLYVRPLWDVWLIVIVGLGLALSVTSVVLAWRRLKITFAPKEKELEEAPVQQSA